MKQIDLFNRTSKSTLESLLSKRIEDMPFSVRASNCLLTSGIRNIGQLMRLEPTELMSIRAFGNKTLREVKALLASMGLSLGMDLDWNPRNGLICFESSPNEVRSRPYIGPPNLHLLRRLDEFSWSVRLERCFKALKVKYIADIVRYKRANLLEIPNLGPRSIAELENRLLHMGLWLGVQLPAESPKRMEYLRKRYSTELDQVKEMELDGALGFSGTENTVLEAELQKMINVVVPSERNRKIITQLWGLDGKGSRTLETVGLEHDLTDERVRQIALNASVKLAKLFGSSKRIKEIHDQVIEFLPSEIAALSMNLQKKGITAGPFNVEGILRVCAVLGIEPNFRIERIKDQHWVVEKDDSLLSKIIPLARSIVARWGFGMVADLCAQANLDTAYAGIVQKLLETSIGTIWLDSDRNWFWIPEVPRNRVLNSMNKILSVAPSISISELRKGLGRHYRMKGFSPPSRVLSALCSHLPYCKVEADIVRADPVPHWQEELSETEKIFYRLLKEFGPVMSRTVLKEKCIQTGMSHSAFYICLEYSPILTRFARGVYGLRGARVDNGVAPELQHPIRRGRKVLIDSGWTEEGKIWLCYKVSEAMLNSGVCSAPVSFKKHLQGSFDLKTHDNTQVGTLTVKDSRAWGLGPFFNRRVGEPGDLLRIEFDLKLGKAEVRLADEKSSGQTGEYSAAPNHILEDAEIHL